MKIGRRDLFDAIAILAVAATLIYVITRTALFLYAEYSLVEKGLAFLLILGEFFVLAHGIGYSLNILKVFMKARRQEDEAPASKACLKKQPSVAILVAARHEPKNILEDTFVTINNINYKNKRVYFLDDSTDVKYKKEADELSREYGLKLFRRTKPRHGAKAGIINDCLESLTEDYVAIFDADQNPLPEFLNALMPILEKDKRLAFIQTPQFYSNIEASPVSRGAAFQQAVFYEYICEGKSLSDSMFCCGTNIVFRRAALMEVGGFDEISITEDFATSIKMHAKGWKSLYYNHTCAFGSGPQSLAPYFKQQFRWAAGTMGVLKNIVRQFLNSPFSLKPRQWWEYFLSSTYYFVGIAFYIMMLCPVIYLLFRVPSFFARPEIYFLVFAPYLLLSLSVFYAVLKQRNYSPKDLFLGQVLGVVAFSVYARAVFSVLFGAKAEFAVTDKTKGKAIPFIVLWPQLLMIFINFIAIVWGFNRFIYELEPAILVNSFWALYHMAVLSSVFYLNKEPA